MPALATGLRSKLENAIIAARDIAEAGARAALEAMAVHHHEPYTHQKPEQRKLRVQLRAHARQLGDTQNPKGELAIGHLVHECAYEHWHRMLFARFLAENDLLIESDSGMAISLAEAEELAKVAKVDLWTYASRCAQQMLPQIFRPDDPLLQVGLANEHRVKLERLLSGLDAATFKADDSLGWVYQFWQSAEQERVNASGEKITGDTLSAVTQLFTEDYMVLFLLHNTIGAWHAGKVLAANPKLAESTANEEALRQAVALKTAGGYSFDYLRFVRGTDGKDGPWRPAAGPFAGWPKTAALIKMLDPCCGSGHFVVAGFELLARLRMAEEGLDLADAVDAVLADNLFGLELDARCTQIAAFNLALAAWKLTGYRQLPPMHIACTGIGPQATEEQWLKLVEQARIPMPALGREPIKNGLLNLHRLFTQAPTLGSLTNPTELPADLITADYETLQPYLTAAMSSEYSDDDARERAVAAQGMMKALALLGGEYTLVITNVPYLGRGKQDDLLKVHLERHYNDAKADLATSLVLRCLELCAIGGSTAVVTPQNWLFLDSYTELRGNLLTTTSIDAIARLGSNAFRGMNWWAAITMLITISRAAPSASTTFFGIDVGDHKDQNDKARLLISRSLRIVHQAPQAKNAGNAITFTDLGESQLLCALARSVEGLSTGDGDRFLRKHWELKRIEGDWEFFHVTPDETQEFDGLSEVLFWEQGQGELRRSEGARVQGQPAWGKDGVLVSKMNRLKCSRYIGTMHDKMAAAIIPNDRRHLPALWQLCSSSEFHDLVREVSQKVDVATATLVQIPFDAKRLAEAARKSYPNGLPEPESDDSTQWLFHGRPDASAAPLLVAVARLLGYRWPAELDDKMRLSKRARSLVAKAESLLKYADDDGIVCIPSVRGEDAAADRLLALLTACGVKPDRNLDEWLRNDFFQEHCELFHQRPFVWHIWDGRKRDGFHALVNYHKLADGKKGLKLLESLTYSYLGEWITRQTDGVKHGEDGAEDRLAAALELQKRLEAILEGEPPFDLFVRWKPLAEQPIGWEPDINDGVRMNIRPFLASDIPGGKKGAGILRFKPNIKWDKDRGKEPERKKAEFPWFWGWDEKTEDFMGGKEFKGERFNECHYTVAAKRKAREAKS